MLTAIRNWVIRTMMKSKGETGIVKTIPKRDIVEINTQITAQRLMENGIDPMSLKNADQVENAIIAIENRPKVQQGIGSTKSADVFDLKGKKIKNPDNIIGGEELPPPGSRGGPDDIAAPVQSSEKTMKNMIEDELMKSENPFSDLVKTTKQGPKTIKEREAEILARMEKDNKAAVQRIKNRKMLDDAIDNASPGFVKGDRKYNAQLVADDLAEKKFGKDFDDLDQKQQMDLYGEALDGLDDLDKFAQGGRAGFKTGLGKRFLDFFKGLTKEKPFSGKEFVDKRKFIGADKIENKIQMMKNKKVLEEARKEFKKNPPFKFPEPGSKEYDEALASVQRALIEDRKLNAEGGRAGYFTGGLMKLLKAASKTSPKQAYTKYLKSVKDRAQKGDMKSLAPELGAVSATGIFVNRRMKDVLENMKNQDMENTLENYIKELDADPFYKDYPDLKDKMIEGYTEMMFGEGRAEGGRIGLKDGMDRRTFMKIMAGLASIPIVGKIFKGAKVASKAAPIAKNVTKSTPPPYFFELAETIKKFGKPDKVTYADRVEVHRYTGKNGDEYELIEDLNTGDMRIQKDKTGIGTYGDKSYDTINDRSVLEFKKGDADVDIETQRGYRSADEYEEYKVEFDADGTEADATELDAVVQKEIIEEVSGESPPIKKAGGGIARMLGE